jgi:putative membrane protein
MTMPTHSTPTTPAALSGTPPAAAIAFRRCWRLLPVALLFTVAGAQAQTAAGRAGASAPSSGMAASGAAASPGASAASGVSRHDRGFLQDAASDGLAEVLLGQLAQQRAASPEVRQFGERMVADHTKANDALKALAQARGLQLPDRPTAAQQRMHDGMAKLQGDVFDRLYMAHMAGDHRKAVSLFQKQAKSGDDAGLKSFAEQTLPTLQDHLKTASALHDRLKQTPRR